MLRQLVKDWPEIKAPRATELLRDEHGYEGSVDLVRKRLAQIRPRSERPAQRTGYRPAQVMQVDWAEMPTRPKIDGEERRVYALICSLPYSGASTAHFSFDLTAESFIEGHVHAKTGFWPARRFDSLAELDRVYAEWRDRVAIPRRHASGHFVVADRLAVERETARPLPPVGFDYAGRRSSRVPLDGYLKLRGSFYRAPEALVHQRVELRYDRDRVWITHRGRTVASYERSHRPGV